VVPLLGEYEAVEMFRAVPGRAIGLNDLTVILEIARSCGHLPLVLRIAGGLLKARPH
jgi:hypothetical protein